MLKNSIMNREKFTTSCFYDWERFLYKLQSHVLGQPTCIEVACKKTCWHYMDWTWPWEGSPGLAVFCFTLPYPHTFIPIEHNCTEEHTLKLLQAQQLNECSKIATSYLNTSHSEHISDFPCGLDVARDPLPSGQNMCNSQMYLCHHSKW